jgi:hypothetical protein
VKPCKEKSPSESQAMPFIVGVPRSGTTLLRLMLDSHKDVAIPTETHFDIERLHAYLDCKDCKEKFLDIVINKTIRFPELGIVADDYRQFVYELNPFNTSVAFIEIYKMYAKRFGKEYYGDKTPGYMRSMVKIQDLVPNAYFIHLVRDGRDVMLSHRNVIFASNGEVYDSARFWKQRILNARSQVSKLNKYVEIRYEDLVCNTENTLRIICDFIDIDFDFNMLEYYKNADKRLDEFSDVGILSKMEKLKIHKLTNNKPDKTRIQKWKKELTKEEIKTFNEIAGDLLDEFNYL